MERCQVHLWRDVVFIREFSRKRAPCCLSETVLPGTVSSVSHWRVPVQCSPLLLCRDLCHLPIYRLVSGQFLSWKVSLDLSHSHSLYLSPALTHSHSHPLSLASSLYLCLFIQPPQKSRSDIAPPTLLSWYTGYTFRASIMMCYTLFLSRVFMATDWTQVTIYLLERENGVQNQQLPHAYRQPARVVVLFVVLVVVAVV